MSADAWCYSAISWLSNVCSWCRTVFSVMEVEKFEKNPTETENTTVKQTQFYSSLIRLIIQTVRSSGELAVIRLCHMVPGGTQAQHGAGGLTELRISYTIRSTTSPLYPSCRLPPRQPFYPRWAWNLTSLDRHRELLWMFSPPAVTLMMLHEYSF